MDLQTLQEKCLACTRCPLCETRQHVVFGQGAADAEVLFVGEGPGQSEDEQGLPFVGRSGQLLDKYLFAIDLDRNQNCYIANIVKCRPPHNRDPLPDESEACMPWLREQFRLLRPKIVVCLGRIAAQRMIRPGFSVTKEHGVFVEKGGGGLYGHLPPCGPAAPAPEQAGGLCRFCGPAGQDPRSVPAHLPKRTVRPFCGKIRRSIACAAVGATGMRPAFRPSLPLRQAFLWHSAPLLHTLCQKRGVLLWK